MHCVMVSSNSERRKKASPSSPSFPSKQKSLNNRIHSIPFCPGHHYDSRDFLCHIASKCVFLHIHNNLTSMRFTKQISKQIFFGAAIICLVLAACQSKPKTDLERIAALKEQVQTDAKALDALQANEFQQLQKTFIACDSMLQYLHPETVDEVFEQLQLTDAYLSQFKMTRPQILSDMDSTLIQLDNLKSDIETRYLSDSLAKVYLETEAAHVELLSNQIQYFKDRFGSCQQELNELKKKM